MSEKEGAFKARAVRLVRDHLADYRSVTAATLAVAAQLSVSRETLRRWVAQAEIDDGARPGVMTPKQRRSAGSRRTTSGYGRPTRSSRPPPRFSSRENSTPATADRWPSSIRCEPRASRSSRSARSCASRACRSPRGPTEPGRPLAAVIVLLEGAQHLYQLHTAPAKS